MGEQFSYDLFIVKKIIIKDTISLDKGKHKLQLFDRKKLNAGIT